MPVRSFAGTDVQDQIRQDQDPKLFLVFAVVLSVRPSDPDALFDHGALVLEIVSDRGACGRDPVGDLESDQSGDRQSYDRTRICLGAIFFQDVLFGRHALFVCHSEASFLPVRLSARAFLGVFQQGQHPEAGSRAGLPGVQYVPKHMPGGYQGL